MVLFYDLHQPNLPMPLVHHQTDNNQLVPNIQFRGFFLLPLEMAESISQ